MEEDINIRRRDDHDLIVRLETKLDQVIIDIKDVKEGINAKVSDHETRLRALESKISNYAGGIVLLQFAIGIVLWYFGRK